MGGWVRGRYDVAYVVVRHSTGVEDDEEEKDEEGEGPYPSSPSRSSEVLSQVRRHPPRANGREQGKRAQGLGGGSLPAW